MPTERVTVNCSHWVTKYFRLTPNHCSQEVESLRLFFRIFTLDNTSSSVAECVFLQHPALQACSLLRSIATSHPYTKQTRLWSTAQFVGWWPAHAPRWAYKHIEHVVSRRPPEMLELLEQPFYASLVHSTACYFIASRRLFLQGQLDDDRASLGNSGPDAGSQ